MALSAQATADLHQTKPSSVIDAFGSLRRYLNDGRWLGIRNAYLNDAVATIDAQLAATPSTINQKHRAEYVAASVPLHAVDGWSYLGRALAAHLLATCTRPATAPTSPNLEQRCPCWRHKGLVQLIRAMMSAWTAGPATHGGDHSKRRGDPKLRPNIAITGLTAAGKTTHALLLSSALGYDFRSASEVLLGKVGFSPGNNDRWIYDMTRIEEQRADGSADRFVDDRLAAWASQCEGTVFDSWFLPYLYRSEQPLVRVYLDSDLESRAMKCLVSQQPTDDPMTLNQCRQLIQHKDDTTVARARSSTASTSAIPLASRDSTTPG